MERSAGAVNPGAVAQGSPASRRISGAKVEESGAAAEASTSSIENNSGTPMRRRLGAWNGASIIIGVIIGSGIFVSPKGVLLDAGSPGASLLVWSLCGLFTMLGALCFAELGTSVHQSGGEYTYIRLAFGPLLAFLYLWVQVAVIVPCSSAISALTFASYVLQPFYQDQASSSCQPPYLAVRLLALALLLLLVYLNCVSVRHSLRLQGAFTLAKVLALGLVVATGLHHLITGQGSQQLASPEAMWSQTETSVARLAQAFYAGYYTYAGWNSLNFVTEEMKDPVRNMPRAIILSITTITLIYILANGAYFAVLSRDEMLQSEAIAVTFGEKTLPKLLNWLMPLAVALSTMGGLNGGIFASSRMFYAGARQGHLFAALQFLHVDQGTPVPALLFLGATSALYLFAGDILTLINYTVFVEALLAAAGVATVLQLRRKLPNLPRPLKVHPLIPLAYLLFSFLLVVLPVWQSPLQSAIGLAILLAGWPIYLATARWKDKPAAYQRCLANLNLLAQRLTMSYQPDGPHY